MRRSSLDAPCGLSTDDPARVAADRRHRVPDDAASTSRLVTAGSSHPAETRLLSSRYLGRQRPRSDLSTGRVAPWRDCEGLRHRSDRGPRARRAIAALLADGHEVTGLARNDAKAAELEAAGAGGLRRRTCSTVDALDRRRSTGFEAVCNLATHMPVGHRPACAAAPGRSTTGSASKARGSSSQAAAERGRTPAGPGERLASCTPMAATSGSPRTARCRSPVRVEPSAVAESNATAFESPTRGPVVCGSAQLIGDDADDPVAARPGPCRASDRLRRPARVGARRPPRRRRRAVVGGAHGSGRRLQRRGRAGAPPRDDAGRSARSSAAPTSASCRGWWSRSRGERMELLTPFAPGVVRPLPRGHRVEAAPPRLRRRRGCTTPATPRPGRPMSDDASAAARVRREASRLAGVGLLDEVRERGRRRDVDERSSATCCPSSRDRDGRRWRRRRTGRRDPAATSRRTTPDEIAAVVGRCRWSQSRPVRCAAPAGRGSR